MKKYTLTLSTMFLVGAMAACGNTNDAGTATPGEDPVSNETNDNLGALDNNVQTDGESNNQSEENTDSSSVFENLSFEEFDLDVEYDHGDYEVDYDYENGSPTAEIEDSREGANENLTGDDALHYLESIFGSMDITVEMSEEEVQAAVIEAFQLEDNYQEFEVDIEFFDGSETEVENE